MAVADRFDRATWLGGRRPTVLVTGGAGFLGLHLVRALIGEPFNARVLVIDDLSSAAPWAERAIEEMGVTLMRSDLAKIFPSRAIGTWLGGATLDLVAHLACPASPVHYWADPIRTLITCAEGTRRVIQVAQELGHEWTRVLHASTSEVYGDPPRMMERPIVEGYRGHVSPIGERASYDEGKRYAEALMVEARHTLDLDVRIARIFNTYGPGMAPDDGRMIPAFLRACLSRRPMVIHGHGAQTRTLTYVDDTVDGLLQLLLMPPDDLDPLLAGNRAVPVYNVCGEVERDVVQVARAVHETVNGRLAPPLLEHVEHPSPHDPTRRSGDTTRLRATGWTPAVGLEEGLRRMVAWARESPTWGDAIRR